MRIFSAVRHSNDPSYFYGGLWSANFYPALRELGHDLVESQTDLYPTSRFMDVAGNFTTDEAQVRAETTERILDEVRQALRQGPIHLFLSYFYNAHFDPDGFNEIRRLGIPSVNFYCNSIHQFPLVAAIAAQADFSWHPERDASASYRGVGANPVHVQMGADPAVYRPIAGTTRQAKACFIGQRYADRDRLAVDLLDAGVPLDLYGSGWQGDAHALPNTKPEESRVYLGRVHAQPGSFGSYWRAVEKAIRTGGVGPGLIQVVQRWRDRFAARAMSPRLQRAAKGRATDVAATFAAYDVVVNFSNVWADARPGSELIPHVRLRDFEAPMARTCYLTGHLEEIEAFYELGTEIDTYRTTDELVEKTRFYLRHPDAAERLRNAGYRRARRDHTWTRRFEQLFSGLGMTA